MTSMDTNRFVRIGTAKEAYLSVVTRLNATRGLFGVAMTQYKRACHIMSGRPTEKNGPRHVPTEAQFKRAEVQKTIAKAMLTLRKEEIRQLRAEVRNRLLAYGYLRNRTFDQMASVGGVHYPTVASFAGVDEASVQFWVKNPTTLPSVSDLEYRKKQELLTMLLRKVSDADWRLKTLNQNVVRWQSMIAEAQREMRTLIDASQRDKAEIEQLQKELADYRAKMTGGRVYEAHT